MGVEVGKRDFIAEMRTSQENLHKGGKVGEIGSGPKAEKGGWGQIQQETGCSRSLETG